MNNKTIEQLENELNNFYDDITVEEMKLIKQMIPHFKYKQNSSQ